jgi:hypothetical protein
MPLALGTPSRLGAIKAGSKALNGVCGFWKVSANTVRKAQWKRLEPVVMEPDGIAQVVAIENVVVAVVESRWEVLESVIAIRTIH